MSSIPFAAPCYGFLIQAGRLADGMRHAEEPMAKRQKTAVGGLVTAADDAISQLFHNHIAPAVTDDDATHVLIDEEMVDDQGIRPNDDRVLGADYLWVCDPIDGTGAFANDTPTYAISLGVMKDHSPWIGGVILPMLGHLYFYDGDQVTLTTDIFGDDPEKRVIKPIINPAPIDGSDMMYIRPNWTVNHLCHTMDPFTASVKMIWAAVGKSVGCLGNYRLWDMAGAWPICRALGLSLFDYKTGDELTGFQVEKFGRGWNLRHHHLICRPDHLDQLRESIDRRW
jgi:fructose-1,6-bisphosphatase/inositol monophosphatase family enzyme